MASGKKKAIVGYSIWSVAVAIVLLISMVALSPEFSNFTGFFGLGKVNVTKELSLTKTTFKLTDMYVNPKEGASASFTIPFPKGEAVNSVTVSGTILGKGSVKIILASGVNNWTVFESETLPDSILVMPITGMVTGEMTVTEQLPAEEPVIETSESEENMTEAHPEEIFNETAEEKIVEQTFDENTGVPEETPEENISKSQNKTITDVLNDTSPEMNITIPEENVTSENVTEENRHEENITETYQVNVTENVSATPEVNITKPENTTGPEENATEPETNITEPEDNITIPDENTIESELNATIPEENITETETNITEPENATMKIPGPVVTIFDDACKDTCIMPFVENAVLIVVIEGNATLNLKSVKYTIEEEIKDGKIRDKVQMLKLMEQLNLTGHFLTSDFTFVNSIEFNITEDGYYMIFDIYGIPVKFDRESIKKLKPGTLKKFTNYEREVRVLLKTNDASEFLMIEKNGDKKNTTKTEKLKDVKKISKDNFEKKFNMSTDAYKEKVLLDTGKGGLFPVEQVIDGYVSVAMNIRDIAALVEAEGIDMIFPDEVFLTGLQESVYITSTDKVHDAGYSGDGIKICVIDTGLNPLAVGLTDGVNAFGYNFVDDNTDYSDGYQSHGTKVTYAITSMAPDATIYMAKVIGDNGVGYASDVEAALDWCEDNSVDIVSMSIGEGAYQGYCDDVVVARKVMNLSANGIIVVAATGNNLLTAAVANPACASSSVRVAASEKNDNFWMLSNYNNATLLVAPGMNIETVDMYGQAVNVTGTSMSAAIVSGITTLLLENRTLAPDEAWNLLVHTGDVIYYYDSRTGYGKQFSRVNAWNALTGNVTNNLTEGMLGDGMNGSWMFEALLAREEFCAYGDECDWPYDCVRMESAPYTRCYTCDYYAGSYTPYIKNWLSCSPNSGTGSTTMDSGTCYDNTPSATSGTYGCDITVPMMCDCGATCANTVACYDACTSSNSCDASLSSPAIWSQDGTCVGTTCDVSSEVAYCSSTYYTDCSSCGSAAVYACDTSASSGGDYSTNGMCTNDNNCYTGDVVFYSSQYETCSGSDDDGYRCDTSTAGAWTQNSMCLSQGNGASYDCETSGVACNDGTYIEHGCSLCDYGNGCDSTITSGDYSATGVCGSSSHGTCCMDYGSAPTSTGPTVCGTETAVCDSEDGYYCDAVSDGSWSPGAKRCDADDNYCDACSSYVGEDADCEDACGASSQCDELDPSGWWCSGNIVTAECTSTNGCVYSTSGGDVGTCEYTDSYDSNCGGASQCDELSPGTDLNQCIGTAYYEDECSSACALQDITTRYECSESGCSCTDSVCDGIAPNGAISYCDRAGTTYYRDMCSGAGDTASDYNALCEDDYTGCTASADCDGNSANTCSNGAPPTGYCSTCTLQSSESSANACRCYVCGTDNSAAPGSCAVPNDPWDASNWPGDISEKCCEDEAGEYIMWRNEYTTAEFSGWNDDTTDDACCNDGTKCVYSGTCYADNTQYDLSGDGRKDAHCYSSDDRWFNTDYLQSWCEAAGYVWHVDAGDATGDNYPATGSGASTPYCKYWADDDPGGFVASKDCCCGDDAGENYRTETTYSRAIAFDNDQAACCDAADNVGGTTCYTAYGSPNVLGEISGLNPGANDDKSFSYTTGWLDCDQGDYMDYWCGTICGPQKGSISPRGGSANESWNAKYSGEAGVGEYPDTSTLECCGDDSGEYYRYQNCDNSYACADDTADDACCNAATDCVNGVACFTSGTSTEDVNGNGDDEYCSSGIWYDCTDTGDCDPTGEYANGESSQPCSGGTECTEACTSNDCIYKRNNGWSDCDLDAACVSGSCIDDAEITAARDGNACDNTNDGTNGHLCGPTGDMWDVCVPVSGCIFDSDWDNSFQDCYDGGLGGECAVTNGDTTHDLDNDGDNDYCSSGTWYDCPSDDDAGDANCAATEYCSGTDCESLLGEGVACTRDGECSDATYSRSCYQGYNRYCQGTSGSSSGQCRRDNGQACTTGDSCGSGVCYEGTCLAASATVCSATTCGNACSGNASSYLAGGQQMGGPLDNGCSDSMPIYEWAVDTSDCIGGTGDTADPDCQANCAGGLTYEVTTGGANPYTNGRCIVSITLGNACCQDSVNSTGSDCGTNMDCYVAAGVAGPGNPGVCRYANGQSCTNGDQCDSDLCVDGTCVASCDGYSGDGCSTDTATWSDAAAGTCYDDGAVAYGCDYTDPIRMNCGPSGNSCDKEVDPSYSTCTTTSGDSCMSGVGGDFVQDGTCASGATNNCDTSGLVASDDGSTNFYADCASGYVCDTTVTGGDFLRDGYCAQTTCADTVIVASILGTDECGDYCNAPNFQDGDEYYECNSTNEGSACSTSPETGDPPTVDGVCVEDVCDTDEVAVNCGNMCENADFIDANVFSSCSGHASESCDPDVGSNAYDPDGICLTDGSCDTDNTIASDDGTTNFYDDCAAGYVCDYAGTYVGDFLRDGYCAMGEGICATSEIYASDTEGDECGTLTSGCVDADFTDGDEWSSTAPAYGVLCSTTPETGDPPTADGVAVNTGCDTDEVAVNCGTDGCTSTDLTNTNIFSDCSSHASESCDNDVSDGNGFGQVGTCLTDGSCDISGIIVLDDGSYYDDCTGRADISSVDSDATSGGDFEKDSICCSESPQGGSSAVSNCCTNSDCAGVGSVCNVTYECEYNTPPLVSNAYITSTSGYNTTSDNITVSYTATDAEDDSITNITDWRLDGTSIAVLNMPFDTNYSATTADSLRDYSTYENNGTLGGGTSDYMPAWTDSGQVGGAYSFDGQGGAGGSGDCIVANRTNITQDITIGFWYKPSEITTTAGIIETSSGGCAGPYEIYRSSADIVFRIRNSTGNCEGLSTASGGVSLVANNWYYITATYDGSYKRLYINGTEIISAVKTGNLSSSSYPMAIGATIDSGGICNGWFDNATIDEVKVYDRALSPEQVHAMYAAGAAGHDVEVIVHDETSAGDNWTVAVTPNDAFVDGNTLLSKWLEVVNSIPVAGNVSLISTSGYNLPSDNLTVTFDSYDADGNIVTNITDWRLDGTSIAVLNMPFDTNVSSVGSELVRDYSTYGNNGTLGNGTPSFTPTWTDSGKIGGAYTFDCVDDVITADIGDSFGIGDFSVSAWVKFNYVNPSLDETIFSYRTPGTGATEPQIILGTDYTFTEFSFITDDNTAESHMIANTSGVSLTDGVWYHVVATRSGSTAKIYVDGVDRTDGSSAASGDMNCSYPAYIGAHWYVVETNGYFNGTIDELIVFNRTLSPEQVWAMYKAGGAGHHSEMLVSQETSLGDVWTVAVTPSDGYTDGATQTSNALEIETPPDNPEGLQWKIEDTSGGLASSLDEDGDLFIAGSLYESQGSLSPSANSFIVQNAAGTTVAYISSAGDLYLQGTVTMLDVSGKTGYNLEIRNVTDDVVAFFDDEGNVKLQGYLIQGYSG